MFRLKVIVKYTICLSVGTINFGELSEGIEKYPTTTSCYVSR